MDFIETVISTYKELGWLKATFTLAMALLLIFGVVWLASSAFLFSVNTLFGTAIGYGFNETLSVLILLNIVSYIIYLARKSK